MANDSVTIFVPGKVYWAKIVGDKALHMNYDGDGKEWSYEFAPDDVTFLKDNKLLDRLKDKEDLKNPDKGPCLNLRKPELNKDGEKNEPIAIYNKDNEPWDNELIGNGSRVVAKLTIKDWGKGKKKSIFTSALRIEDLVKYEGNVFSAYDSTATKSEAKAKTPKTKVSQELDDLEDEIPF